MTRTLVRADLTRWLDDAGVVDKVHRTLPKHIEPKQFGAGPWRCQAVVHIASSEEVRVASGLGTPGQFGWRRRRYLVEFHLFGHWTDRDAESAADRLDEVIEGVAARLHADHEAGSGTIFEVGETGGIDTETGWPKTMEGGATEIWGVVRFVAHEFVQA